MNINEFDYDLNQDLIAHALAKAYNDYIKQAQNWKFWVFIWKPIYFFHNIIKGD